MPELPEVETVRRELIPHLQGRTLVRVEFLWPGVAATQPAEEMAERLQGRRVEGVRRRGKFLILDLDDDWHLLIHLRMSGRLYLRPAQVPGDHHTRAVLYLDDGRAVHFWDQRKFGRFYLVEDEGEIGGTLGPEPLSPDWRVGDLARALARRRAAVKALLMNQQVVAGLGNIYADEALFLAGVHPLRRGGDLSEEEVARLHRAIRQVLQEAIGARGTSLTMYVPPSERRGRYQEVRRVYQRTGEPCSVCGTPVERLKVAGRSTHFCPVCQPPQGVSVPSFTGPQRAARREPRNRRSPAG